MMRWADGNLPIGEPWYRGVLNVLVGVPLLLLVALLILLFTLAHAVWTRTWPTLPPGID